MFRSNIPFLSTAPVYRGFSTSSTHHIPAVFLCRNTTRPTQFVSKAVQRGNPRRCLISTASAIAFFALFFGNCIITVYATNFSREHHRVMGRYGVLNYLSQNDTSVGLYEIDRMSLRGGDIERSDAFDVFPKSPPPIEFAHGTTTLAFIFQGGIVAAVDSRAR